MGYQSEEFDFVGFISKGYAKPKGLPVNLSHQTNNPITNCF
jgi:hypothetical protein